MNEGLLVARLSLMFCVLIYETRFRIHRYSSCVEPLDSTAARIDLDVGLSFVIRVSPRRLCVRSRGSFRIFQFFMRIGRDYR